MTKVDVAGVIQATSMSPSVTPAGAATVMLVAAVVCAADDDVWNDAAETEGVGSRTKRRTTPRIAGTTLTLACADESATSVQDFKR